MASKIPKKVLHEFFEFLNRDVTTFKNYYSIDENGDKILTRVVEEKRPPDLKATISLFEKMYPQYFDKLNSEKLIKLQKASGGDSDDFAKIARNMLSI